MPKIVDPGAERREIRRAARRVFSRRGVAGTGLGQVAAAAGRARSSLYHYYPDKAALVRDLTRELLAEEEAVFAAALQGVGSPLERIAKLASGTIELFNAWAELGRMLFDLRFLRAPRLRRFFQSIRRDLARLIAEGQRAGEIDARLDPALAAATLIGTIDGLLLQHYVDRNAFSDREALRTALVSAVRKLLAP